MKIKKQQKQKRQYILKLQGELNKKKLIITKTLKDSYKQIN